MKPVWVFLALLLTGCSTAPLADVMDFFYPGRLPSGELEKQGGVCLPQGYLPATSTPVPIGGAAVPPPVPAGAGAAPLSRPIPIPGEGSPTQLPPAGSPVPFPPK